MSDSREMLKAVMGSDAVPILIVEDKAENQTLLRGMCKRMAIKCDVAENGKVAIDMCQKQKYSVYIVDLMMPVMDGREFIEELKKIQPEAVILIQSALDSPDTIIDLMKKGVYDYIIKPLDPALFQQTLLKAIEYHYLKEIEYQQSLSAGDKIRAQIEWLNYKEKRRLNAKDTAESKSIYNVKTSLAQGAGFGTIITLIDILENTAQEAEDGKMLVEKDIIDMLISNNDYCRSQIDGLNFATKIMEGDFDLTEFSTAHFIGDLERMISRVLPFLKDKNIKLTFPELKDSSVLRYNEKAISLIIEEVIVNAYKYSVKGSVINIFSHINKGYLWLAVKNTVAEKPYGGIPKDYEKLVLEPFFRIHPPDESVSKVERIGFGLGLAVADYVAKKHGGIFFIHDIRDMRSASGEPCVLAELLLPIYK